ncbi:uclacyanin 1-like [Apium graveolens]|uniref:uclacyanin 1-like n=1 Tax=Apium graveolens TaxID=4045 RepID=UPI003D7BEA1B
MSMARILLCLAAAAMIVNSVIATTTFTVGGPTGGWDTATDLQAWSSSQAFSVGDNLIFQYTPNHNVLEVSKEDYDACQNSNPIKVYPSGATPISLTSHGSRYFICGAPAHCSLGMKIEVVTLAASAPLPALSPDITTQPSDPSTSPAAFFPSPTETTPTSQQSASMSPRSVPSFPLSGSPQSFDSANTLSTEPTTFSAANERATSSIVFSMLMLVPLFV